MKYALLALIALSSAAAPAMALEQNCRFIQAKVEREACYKRQEEELAARRKPEPARHDTSLDSLRRMRQGDDAVYRSIHGICRGC